MPNLNRIIICGHLGRDPELKYTPSGTAVCDVSCAVTSKWKNGEHTEWFNVVAWAKSAEFLAEHGSKGAIAIVEGEIRTEKWQDKEGRDRYTTKLVAQRVQLIGGKRAKRPEGAAEKEQDFDDDIPF